MGFYYLYGCLDLRRYFNLLKSNISSSILGLKLNSFNFLLKFSWCNLHRLKLNLFDFLLKFSWCNLHSSVYSKFMCAVCARNWERFWELWEGMALLCLIQLMLIFRFLASPSFLLLRILCLSGEALLTFVPNKWQNATSCLNILPEWYEVHKAIYLCQFLQMSLFVV